MGTRNSQSNTRENLMNEIPEIDLTQVGDFHIRPFVLGGADNVDLSEITLHLYDRKGLDTQGLPRETHEGIIRMTKLQLEEFIFQAQSMIAVHTKAVEQM